jgi:6,7-dimethyl-8-ribityllumazine synthase
VGRPEEAPAPLGDASPFRFAVVVSRFNTEITGSLREAALAALREAGAAGVEVFDVPGAYEIPQAARAAAEAGRFDAIVCLGCVIRGETPHFDYISSAVAHGIMTAAGNAGVPMAFGVLTVDTLAQAHARAGAGSDNKGREAAAAAIEMALLYGRIEGRRRTRRSRPRRSKPRKSRPRKSSPRKSRARRSER